MACSNNALFRSFVRIEKSPFHHVPVPGIIRLSGLELGQRGKETITEQNRTISVVDNVRTLPTLSFDIRLQEKPDVILAIETLKKIWKGYSENRTIWVDIIGKYPAAQWTFKKSAMSNFKESPKELGKGMAFYTVDFEPYDVEFKNLGDLNLSKKEMGVIAVFS